MGNKRAKILGIAIIFVAFLITAFGSLAVTNLSILDTDASTYVIVVMLMLFVFICFSAKEDLNFEYKKRNILYSALVFLIYLLLLSYLRVTLSSAFLSYRIDALLLPLPLFSFIMLVFGTSGAKRLWPLIIYAAFASPLILMPLLNLNSAFASLNAVFVYDLIKGIGVPVSKVGLTISSVVGSGITISTTCVSIGTFVAFIMFLLPLAYLYEGEPKDKIYWVLSGVILILFLNLVRMVSISLVWVFFGISNAVNIFHAFAGQLLFYIAIIIMVLIAYKYGLEIKRSKKSGIKARRVHDAIDKRAIIPIIVALAFALVALGFNSGYTNSVYAPAILFSKNSTINQIVLNQMVLASLEKAENNILILGATPQGELFLLRNGSNVNNSVYLVTNVSIGPVANNIRIGYLPIGKPNSYLLRDGITITTQTAYSENGTFELNYFALPYNLSGSWVTVNYMLFSNVNVTSLPDCALMDYKSVGYSNYIESWIYGQGYTDKGLMCQSYLIASSG